MTEFKIEEASVSASAKARETAPSPERKQEENKNKRLWLNVTGMAEEDIEELMETLCFYQGETPVCFVDKEKGTRSMCSERVSVSRALMAELSSFLPDDCIKLA